MKFCFSVVAHVDSGKTTLCRQISKKFLNKEDISLDNLSVEKARNITVKLKQFSFIYNNNKYFFIDTPGHEEFFSEVERSLAVTENVFCLIDSRKGIQCQTKKICELLLNSNKKVFLIFNKIDLCVNKEFLLEEEQRIKDIGLDVKSIFMSAKNDVDLKDLTELFANLKPMSKEYFSKDAFGHIFDIRFSNFGFYCFLRTNISLYPGSFIVLSSGLKVKILKIFYQTDTLIEIKSLEENDIGVILIKSNNSDLITTGEFKLSKKDTFLNKEQHKEKSISNALIFFEIYSEENEELFQSAIKKIFINDPSIFNKKTSNNIFGIGYIIGMKGRVHIEVFLQRIRQEFNTKIILTIPSFVYKTSANEKIIKSNLFFIEDKKIILKNFTDYQNLIKFIPKPKLESYTYEFDLSINKSNFKSIKNFLDKNLIEINNIDFGLHKTIINFNISIADINQNFLSNIKNLSSGNYILDQKREFWQESDAQPLHILINGKIAEGFSRLVSKNNVEELSNKITTIVSSYLAQRNFQVKVSALWGNKIINSSFKTARPNNVAGKCYGGDVTRKNKLYKIQKAGRIKQKTNFEANLNIKHYKEIFLELEKFYF